MIGWEIQDYCRCRKRQRHDQTDKLPQNDGIVYWKGEKVGGEDESGAEESHCSVSETRWNHCSMTELYITTPHGAEIKRASELSLFAQKHRSLQPPIAG